MGLGDSGRFHVALRMLIIYKFVQVTVIQRIGIINNKIFFIKTIVECSLMFHLKKMPYWTFGFWVLNKYESMLSL